MHARANRRLSACDRIFDISGKQGLNRPRTAGQEDNIGVDAMLGENASFFGDPRNSLAESGRDESDGNFALCGGVAARNR